MTFYASCRINGCSYAETMPSSTFTNMDSLQFAHTLIRPNRLLSAAEVLLSVGKRQILDITLTR